MKENRRDFIKKTGGCALGMVSLATSMQHMGAISAMAQRVMDSQPQGGADYKALILIFLQGGNDGNNMIIPNHSDATVSNWDAYNALRVAQSSGGLAFSQPSLAGTSAVIPNIAGLTYAFHPNLGPQAQNGTTIVNNGIFELFGQNKLAAVLNVGTLARPMSKSEFTSGTLPRPYQLFSHSDQVAQAQTSISTTQSFTGWGGRLADKMNPGFNMPNGLIPMVTSISGAQLFTAGQGTLPMAIGRANNTGASNLTTILTPAGFSATSTSTARMDAFNALRGQDLGSNYVAAASHVTDLAMQANSALGTSQDVTTLFPNTNLGLQLKQVARLIKSKDTLNINRQVFYVQIGSFDTHTNQIAAAGSQNSLMTELSQAMRALWDELGVQGVQDKVTSFTLSDFSRTLQPAGVGGAVGSDHAWGNNMLVMGGAVNGGNFYGSHRKGGGGDLYPTLALAGPDDIDGGSNPRGRWLPTTSVDQYAVRLARWFGLSPADEPYAFPNLQYFNDSQTVLDFMQ